PARGLAVRPRLGVSELGAGPDHYMPMAARQADFRRRARRLPAARPSLMGSPARSRLPARAAADRAECRQGALAAHEEPEARRAGAARLSGRAGPVIR